MEFYWVHSCEGYLISNDSKFYIKLEDAIDQYFQEIAGWRELRYADELDRLQFTESCEMEKPELIKHFENNQYACKKIYDDVSVWIERIHTEYKEEEN